MINATMDIAVCKEVLTNLISSCESLNIEEENVTPIYTELKGWNEDLTGMIDASKIPAALNDYILFLEKELEIPITIVSVGPDRTQTIVRR